MTDTIRQWYVIEGVSFAESVVLGRQVTIFILATLLEAKAHAFVRIERSHLQYEGGGEIHRATYGVRAATNREIAMCKLGVRPETPPRWYTIVTASDLSHYSGGIRLTDREAAHYYTRLEAESIRRSGHAPLSLHIRVATADEMYRYDNGQLLSMVLEPYVETDFEDILMLSEIP